nr:MAG: hypothetical protein DiTV3a_F2ORF7 [Diabrotica toursvirus 3a]
MVIITRIQSRNDIPYGVLSNGYEDYVNLDGKYWSSVLNYVTGDYNNFILEPPYNFNFNRKWREMEKLMINIGIKHGIECKLENDPEFERLLIDSGTLPILYSSEDLYVGVDFSTNNGDNIYGKWLTTYRNILLSNSSRIFYNLYVLDKLCKVAIYHESLEEYLINATVDGFTLRMLIEKMYAKYGNLIDLPDKTMVEEIRQVSKQQFATKPEEVILNVIKQKIRHVKEKNLKVLQDKIFYTFVSHVIKTYGINYTPEEFIKKVDVDEREYSTEIVYESYLRNLLPNLQISYDLYIPSQEEIQRLEQLTITVNNTHILPRSKYNVIVDSRTSRLSLRDDRVLITFKGNKFPSISHLIVYFIGSLILNFNPYDLILNSEDNKFFHIEISKQLLDRSLNNFKENYFVEKLKKGIYARIEQHPYLEVYLKSLSDNSQVILSDYEEKTTNEVYNDLRQKISWEKLLKVKGNVVDFIDVDDFFLFILKEMVDNFFNIYSVCNLPDYSINNIRTVFHFFYETLPGVNLKRINTMNFSYKNVSEYTKKLLGIQLSDDTCRFLKKKFMERILSAEYLAKNKFNTNSIFMTKFLILESRHRIFQGEFVDPSRVYPSMESKERVAMVKIINTLCSLYKVTFITKDIVDRAFFILTTTSQIYTEKHTNVVKTTESKNVSRRKDEDDFIHAEVDSEPEDSEEEIYETGSESEPEYDPVAEAKAEAAAKAKAEAAAELEAESDPGNDSGDDYDDLNYDDIMFESSKKIINADNLSSFILGNLNTDKEIAKYLNGKIKELSRCVYKNVFRINLWQ